MWLSYLGNVSVKISFNKPVTLYIHVNYAGVGYPYAFTAKASCTRNLFSLFASYIDALLIGRKRRVVQIEKKGNEKDWGRKKNNREI